MEGALEKRIRKCSGIKRKRRDTPAMAKQVRASRRRRKLTPEAKQLKELLEKIEAYEEKLKMAHTLIDNQYAPLRAADERIVQLVSDLEGARAARARMEGPDKQVMDGLNCRRLNIETCLEAYKKEARALIDKFTVDSNQVAE